MLYRLIQALIFALSAAAFAYAWSADAKEPTIPGPLKVTVTRVVDGDTIDITAAPWPGLQTTARIRIRGIDTPEKRARCEAEAALAAQATAMLKAILAGAETITITDIAPGKYAGRYLAHVYADGQHVGHTLALAGVARLYDGGRRETWCPPAASAQP